MIRPSLSLIIILTVSFLQMPWSFLTIPPEIRDVIIETALLSSRPAPPDIATAALTRQTVVETWDYRNKPFLAWDYGIRKVKFEKPGAYILSNALPLLLTNRRLNAETRSTIARLGDKVGCYKLDVMIVNEGELWPTWTCIPVLTRHVEQVNVTLRLYAGQHLESGYSAPGDGSPPSLLWSSYFILEHFLKRGPVGTFGIGEKDKEICVKVINMAFTAGEEQQIKMLEERPLRERIERAAGMDNTRIIQPLRIAQMISRGISELLSMYYSTAEFGAILYERVGIIRVLVDGEIPTELNIARVLAELAFYNGDTFIHLPRENRISFFWKWKRDTVKLRIRCGLPVEEGGRFEQ